MVWWQRMSKNEEFQKKKRTSWLNGRFHFEMKCAHVTRLMLAAPCTAGTEHTNQFFDRKMPSSTKIILVFHLIVGILIFSFDVWSLVHTHDMRMRTHVASWHIPTALVTLLSSLLLSRWSFAVAHTHTHESWSNANHGHARVRAWATSQRIYLAPLKWTIIINIGVPSPFVCNGRRLRISNII